MASKGIREAALSKEEPPVTKSLLFPHDYDTFDYDYDGFEYTTRKSPITYSKAENYSKYDLDPIESVVVEPGQFQIALAISLETMGESANPDAEGFDFAGMLDLAEQMAETQLTALIPQYKEKFFATINSIENPDNITVMFTLDPK